LNILEIIAKKRDGLKLNKEEIEFFVNGYTEGKITDYQAAALVMAIYIRGMDDEEITNLTVSMAYSGEVLDLSAINGIKVDKHSTGGVGDKTSLVIAPIVASLGIKFAKMSGRGLGHTGGTLDKLESIPGYDITMSDEDFIKQVNDIGIALIGQTADLAPADKKLYALRDVTATVESIPLIASSIMSKKLAAGSDVICLDVKVGSGAFMKNVEQATKLAKLMVEIGKKCGKDMTAVLTNMDEPLGYAVGNSLEVVEAINTLNGNGPADFTELCLVIASHIILGAKYASNLEEAKVLAIKQIENKEALHTLAKLIKAQGGDDEYIFNPDKFPKAKYTYGVITNETGYVSNIDALAIGNAAMHLGAGRAKLSDVIDHSVGIVLHKKVGFEVNENDTLATIYSNKEDVSNEVNMILDAYKIGKDEVKSNLILKIVK
jgi:pyrimidine-nucleoside phosphorylase